MEAGNTATDFDPNSADKHSFQADVTRLLHMMVHSVYSDRSIFLRELISNAADACEKLRFEALSDPTLTPEGSEFTIRIKVDKENSSVIVADNGIGMNRAELIEALGTIAHSGTRAFLERQSGQPDAEKPSDEKADADTPSQTSHLIGQFGVGFYSAFIVADHVTVLSRKAGESDAWKWISDGKGSFSVAEAKTEDMPRQGTQVILKLKSDASEFLERYRLESIIREHSAAIQVPIELSADKGEEFARITDGKAIWRRSKSSVAKEEYTEFYRELARQFDEPAVNIHWHAEGRYEYSVLAFIPGSRPLDLFDPARKGRARLYVRSVLISDDADLLPAWLRFVRIVVDAADVPLNISRELVQKSPIIAAIKKAVTNRILQELSQLAKGDAAKFAEVWKNFGAVIKEGLYEDAERRDQIFEVARFASTRSNEPRRTLKDYVSDLKENQTAIYYFAGEDQKQLLASPQLEGFRARGVEVLILSDPVDAFWTTTALGYEGKPFKSVTQGAVDLSAIALDQTQDRPEPTDEATLAAFLAFAKQTLSDVVEDARSSDKLSESPACLVASENGMDKRLEKILADHGRLPQASKPILEINPSHALVRELSERLQADSDKSAIEDAVWMLFDEARIIEGERPSDPLEFRQRLFRILSRTLG